MMADHPPSAMEARTKTVANIRNTMGIVFPIGEEKSLECREHASDMEAAGSRILPFLSNSCSTGFDSVLDKLSSCIESEFVNLRRALIQLRLRLLSNEKLRLLVDLKAIRDDIEKKKMASNDYIAFLKKWKDLMDAVITEFGPLSDRSYLKEGTIEMTERKTSYLRKLYGGGRDLSGSSYKIGSTAGKAGRPNNTETYTLDGKDYTLGTGPARSDVGPELSKNSPTSIPEKGLEEIEMKNASEHEADYLIYTAADKDPAVDMFYSSNEGGAQQDARFLFDYGALPKNADLINEGYAGENYSFLDNPSADMSRLDDLSLRFDTHMINPSIAKTGIGNSSLPEISGSDLFRNEHEPAGQLGDPSMTQVLNPELGLEAGFGFDQDYSIAVDKFQTKGFASQIHDWASSAAIVQRDTEDGALMQQDTPESHMNDDATQD